LTSKSSNARSKQLAVQPSTQLTEHDGEKVERFGSRETRKSLIRRERKKKPRGGKLRPIIKKPFRCPTTVQH
jgi:hypothetical protein